MTRKPSSRPARKSTSRKTDRRGKGASSKTRAWGRARETRAARPRRHLLRGILKWGFVAGVWAIVAVTAVVAFYAYDLPEIGSIPSLERRPAVTLLAADGSTLARFGDAHAKPVTIKELPPYVPQAFIATEDARFYSHFGIDLIGLARAMAVNLWHGRIVQGGSTITQQLAKNLFFGPQRTVKRKIHEMLMALWLEHKFTKNQILALYLNRVYFGAGNFGIEAASESYFGKHARQLSLNEAAMLAGLLKAPSRYAPTRHPNRAAERAAVVLQRMADAGFITEAQAHVVALNPARLDRQRVRVGRYFADWALDQARDYVGSGQGRDLIVRTTLDAGLQRVAEHDAKTLLDGLGKARNVGQVALLVMSPGGAVRAMVGGVDYGQSQFNRATQALRQPGSAFKPIVYLAGLDSGLTPGKVLEDAPIRIGNFAPENYEGTYAGRVTMLDALARSLNTVAVRVLEHAGVDRVIDWARKLGITSPLRREAGLALGASEVTLTELVSAYAAFANGGYGVLPHGVVEITDSSGKVLYQRQGSGLGRVVPAKLVYEMNKMMQAVMKRGTGRNAAINVPTGGKTGTTQHYRDAWFVGYSADYVAGVWMGNDDGSPMKRVTGSGLPSRLWHEVMADAHRGLVPKKLPGEPGSGFWSRLFGGGDDSTPATDSGSNAGPDSEHAREDPFRSDN